MATSHQAESQLGRLFATLLVGSVAVVGCIIVSCQTTEDARERRVATNHVEHAVLWRGFTHEWGYNHRLNRLGNYVTLAGCHATKANRNSDGATVCTGQAVHTAATGVGNDRGKFTTYFSTLRSDSITFTEGNVSLQFTGREEKLLTDQAVLKVPLESPLKASDTHLVYLNGFDLRTRAGSRAKKLRSAAFSVDRQPTVHRGADTLTFRIHGELNANCDSMECKSQKNRVRYIADIRWLMISGADLQSTRSSVQREYKWDKKQELTRDRLSPPPEVVLEGKSDVPSAAVGWTEMGIEVGSYRRGSGKEIERDHWFVEWSLALPAGEYASGTGTYRLQPDLFFKQWNQETRRRMTSIAKRGRVTLTGEITMIQHRDLQVEHRSVQGEVEWRGKNAAARTEKAVTRKSFSF